MNNILSNREIAVLSWGLVYFLNAMRSLPARRSVANFLIILWQAKKALLIFVLPTFIGVVLLGALIHMDLCVWKEILVWTITSALLNYSFKIIEVKTNKHYFKLVGKMLKSIPLIWFVVEYTSFSIWWELFIVPVSFFLTKLNLFEELGKKENKGVKKIVKFLYNIFFVVWVYSFYKTLNDPSFWSIETFQTFIVSPFLTIIYVILAYPILLFTKYESSFKAINKIIDDQSRAAYRRKMWKFSRFNLNKISHCDYYIYYPDRQSSDTLKHTIDLAITSYKKPSYKYEIQNN